MFGGGFTMSLSKEEERLSQYIDILNQTGTVNREQSDDQEMNEMIDTVNLMKFYNIVEMPTPDFQEKVRLNIKKEVEERQQKVVPIKTHKKRTWKKYYLPLVAASLVVLSVCLPTLFPNQKAEAEQIRVVKEEQLVSLGVSKVNVPAILSDGKSIGFEKDEKIVVWDQGNQSFKQFPLDSFQYMRSPEWSPDEKKIAFSGYKTMNAGIWVMEQDGSNVRQLAAPESPDDFYDHPTWSPDGKKLAFAKQSYKANDSHGFTQTSEEIWMIDLETGKLTKITDGSEPSWSPNGKNIAYTKTRIKGESIQKEVWLISKDGSNRKKLTDGMEPKWSPTGQFITFTRNTTTHKKVDTEKQKAEIVTTFREIWAMDVNSKTESQLTMSKVDEQELNNLISSSKSDSSNLPLNFVMSGQYDDWQPSWSKDGKSIVFVRDTNEEKDNHFSLMKIDLKYE
jgi:TolB protein